MKQVLNPRVEIQFFTACATNSGPLSLRMNAGAHGGSAFDMVIEVRVQEAYLHCAKALKRSKLWEPDYRQDRTQMPSIARMILEQTSTQVAEPEAAKIDAEVEEDYRTALY